MSEFSVFDSQMMARAITLAKKGMYTTAPNPNVGCVITKNNEIVGEGYHFKAGEPHAEVHALRMADKKAHGATAYVTLEPCSHYGRTPPCAEGLINAGVSKVICAMQDPNPQVSGRGIKMLQEAGIEVLVGLLESDADDLNPGFIKKMKTGMPFIQLKMGASLDGQTALSNGQSQWITSSESRKDVQRFRALSGSILSTSKTVIDDNASLNIRYNELPDHVRHVLPESQLRQPPRVILDRQGSLAEQSTPLNLFQKGNPPVVVNIHGDIAPTLHIEKIDLPSTLRKVSDQYNINHIWVEAGSTLASALIKAQLVDELVIYLAPKLMGSDGRGLIGALGLENMDEIFNMSFTDVRQIGQDIRVIAKIQYNSSH
ncbi:bifunctional diaminohydroxyphosphoribosylaminopyrimidine deaminase/5-amino-6-(5-phosphoribosylamino)uracil reductase RibD [Vibrio sp.]|nr:bifunctional diaminohydroxyphosphoribosylaminopyrimidine deaminase/5-amino-6-(5-phosphoribosylamino)uracil reductase RibD [Vibrio sp.]